MATANNTPIPDLESQISNLQGQANQYQSQLHSSPSALGGGYQPTFDDTQAQTKLTALNGQIQTLNDQKLRQQWYGPNSTAGNQPLPEGATSPGLMGEAVDFLSKPLYGVVGAYQHLAGEGTSGSFFGDVAANMQTGKKTFGDELKGSGLPYAVAAPLGFALDVAADPVNWVTMGEGATIPRIFYGLAKGTAEDGLATGVRAALKGAESSALQKTATVASYVPYLNKSGAFAKLAAKAGTSAEQYEGLVGRSVNDVLSSPAGMGVGPYRVGLDQLAQAVKDKIPGGEAIYNALKYDPGQGWVRQAQIADSIKKSLGVDFNLSGAVDAHIKGKSMDPFIEKAYQEGASTIKAAKPAEGPSLVDSLNNNVPMNTDEVDKAMSALPKQVADKFEAIAPSVVQSVDDTAELLKNPQLGMTLDQTENANRLAAEVSDRIGDSVSLDDIRAAVDSGALGETGVKWFDSMMNSFSDAKLLKANYGGKQYAMGKTMLDGYKTQMAIFKRAVVGASPRAFVNAIGGNPAMAGMVGINIFDGTYWKWASKVGKLYAGKSSAASILDDLMLNEDVARYMDQYPTTFSRTFGTSAKWLGTQFNVERVLKAAQDGGAIPAGVKVEDLMPDAKAAFDELSAMAASSKDASQTTGAEAIKAASEGADRKGVLTSGLDYTNTLKSAQAGKISKADLPTGLLSNESMESENANAIFDRVKANAADPAKTNLMWKALDFTFNKMPGAYENIDQSFKLGLFLHGTQDGFTLNELRTMRHTIELNPEDVMSKWNDGGTWRYRISAQKSMILANTVYMNYNAMPGIVRVMKNLPILGSPFVSFTYGMAQKTAQALAYNPSFFTKQNFLFNDFGGQKGPLEKTALQTQYYNYLNNPGMLRVPGNDQNPLYVNMANLLPYYSFNMFQPQEQKYSATLNGDLVNAVEQSPLMKDPIGSVLFDYILQPLLLQGTADQAQGQFGQPLYPADATGIQKAGYGARSLGESFVPGLWQYAGLVTPESAAQYLPGYHARVMSEAKAGDNPYGISGSEPALSRTIRGILGATGVPVQAPVNLTFKPNSSTN